jgi:glycerol uptake facilitator-like aquaporin
MCWTHYRVEGRKRAMSDGQEFNSPHRLTRRLFAEALGSFLLFATVIGSGIMGESLAGGNIAVALLGNTLATGAMLFVLIAMLGPVSGAQFNPAVSLVMAFRGDLAWRELAPFIAAQLFGGVLGVWAAHVMFDLPIIQFSQHSRTGTGQWLGEFIASFGLVLTILGTARHRPAAIPASVALYIVAAYWFTSSTSFANPAVTIARALSDTFAGIAPPDVPGFVLAQLAGALAAHFTARWLFDAGD